MAADNSSPLEPGPFDVATVRQLIALMGRHDLNEIDLQDGVKRIRLRRGLRAGAVMPPVALPSPVPPPPAAPTHSVAEPAPQAAAKTSKKTVAIKSPGVGTFYVASKPGAEPFVKVGSRVTPTTTVGILEAMKIMNEIHAECSGVVVEVVAENQKAVEHNQVLFLVDPAG